MAKKNSKSELEDFFRQLPRAGEQVYKLLGCKGIAQAEIKKAKKAG